MKPVFNKAMMIGVSLLALSIGDSYAASNITVKNATVPEFGAFDDKRFSKTGVLKELDLFQSYQKAQKSSTNASEGTVPDKISEISLAFHGRKKQKEPGFLYFSDQQDEAVDVSASLAAKKSLSLRSRSLAAVETQVDSSTPALLSVPSNALATDRAAGQFSGGMVSLNYGIRGDGLGEKEKAGFDLGVKSSVQILPVDTLSASQQSTGLGLSQTSYDVDFTVGYAGINLAAGIRREEGLMSADGFDVGLAFLGDNFSTSLMLGEYEQGERSLFNLRAGNPDKFQSVRLGASYYLGSSFSLTGGIRYDNYGSELHLRGYGANRSMFYLGTSLRF